MVEQDDSCDLQKMAGEPLCEELQDYVVDTSFLGPWIKHPLVQGPLMLPGHANRQLKAKREYLEQAASQGKWHSYIFTYERPYRMEALYNLWSHARLTKEQLRELLQSVWIDTELPHQFGAVPRRLFTAAGFLTDAPSIWSVLPDVLTIYRGSSYRPTPTAISWTLARGMGEWYARRFNRRHGRLWRGEVNKAHAWGYFESRGEAEVVVTPRAVRNIECVTMGDTV